MLCAPGERCQNVKTYYFKDFKRPSIFDKARAAHADSTSQGVQGMQEMQGMQGMQGKEDMQDGGGHFGMRMARPLKPTITDLSAEQVMKARMVKASRIAFEQSFEKAQDFLDEHSIAYDIDESLSTKESLVLHSEDDVKIAYRGTKIQRHQDLTTDAAIAVGVEAHHPEFKNSEEQLRLVTEKFGAPSELVGFSLGASKAITLGSKHSIHTTTFNPFIGKNLIQSSRTGDEVHSIIRTTEDPVSLGIGLAKSKKNWRVESILPHHDKLNPNEAHELHNFTDQSVRRPGHTEALLRDVHAAGQRAGELEMLHSMKTSQEQGHSFTDWTHRFNGGKGQDTTSDGSHLAGSRIHRNSRQAKGWSQAKASNGSSSPTFTASELEHFEHLGEQQTTYADAHGPEARDKFLRKSPAERQAAIVEAHEHLGKVADVANGHTEMHTASANLFKRAVHPTSLGTGLAGGLAAAALMEGVDPHHHLNEPTRLGVEGVASGVATEMGMAALAGTALSASTLGIAGVAGGASYLAGAGAGSLTTSVLESAHVDETTAEGVGAGVGGAVGGFVAAGTAIGGAAIMGTEIGTFAGPVGMAIGAGLGSIVGLIGFGLGRAFGGHG